MNVKLLNPIPGEGVWLTPTQGGIGKITYSMYIKKSLSLLAETLLVSSLSCNFF